MVLLIFVVLQEQFCQNNYFKYVFVQIIENLLRFTLILGHSGNQYMHSVNILVVFRYSNLFVVENYELCRQKMSLYI